MPAPSSLTTKRSQCSSLDTVTRAVAPGPACLATFCIASRQQKYTAASTSGRNRVVAMSSTVTGTGARLAAPSSPSRSPPVSSSDGRMPWARDRSSSTAAGHVLLQRADQLAGPLGAAGGEHLGQLELDLEGGQVRLRAIVEIALQPAPLGVGDGHEPGPRALQLGVAGPQLVDPRLQLGVQPGVLQGAGDRVLHPRQGLVVGPVEERIGRRRGGARRNRGPRREPRVAPPA